MFDGTASGNASASSAARRIRPSRSSAASAGTTTSGDLVGHLVGAEHPVELGLGRRARTVAVVQVDDRAGEQALGVDRRQGAVGQRAGDLGDAVGVPAGGER